MPAAVPDGGKVSRGDRVSVHYTGTLDDGAVFDSSQEREPLEFTVGDGEVIPGFEDAVIGMSPGDEKTVVLSPSEAYGEYDREMLVEGPRDKFPANVEAGQSFHVHLQGDEEADAVVKEVRKDSVVLDFNHPLAGQRLTFRIRVLNID